jgi:hypothetical protein
MILSKNRINYLNEFKNVVISNEFNDFKTNNVSLTYIIRFLNSLEIDKNYVCEIDFIPNLSDFNIRFYKQISEPFLINNYSSPELIYDLIMKNIKNKFSFRSVILIRHIKIINIEK